MINHNELWLVDSSLKRRVDFYRAEKVSASQISALLMVSRRPSDVALLEGRVELGPMRSVPRLGSHDQTEGT